MAYQQFGPIPEVPAGTFQAGVIYNTANPDLPPMEMPPTPEQLPTETRNDHSETMLRAFLSVADTAAEALRMVKDQQAYTQPDFSYQAPPSIKAPNIQYKHSIDPLSPHSGQMQVGRNAISKIADTRNNTNSSFARTNAPKGVPGSFTRQPTFEGGVVVTPNPLDSTISRVTSIDYVPVNYKLADAGSHHYEPQLQEDPYLNQRNLNYAQQPKTYQQMQQEADAAQAAEYERQRYRAQIKAENDAWTNRVMQPWNDSMQKTTIAPAKVLKGHVESFYDATGQLDKAVWKDPNSTVSIKKQLANGNANKIEQMENNLDHLKAEGKISEKTYQEYITLGTAIVAERWAEQDSVIEDDTCIYHGIAINQEQLPLVAYSDAEHYLKTGKRLDESNWKAQVKKTASGFLKGLGNGIVAGAGARADKGEEGAYAVGDFISAVGINVGAVFTTGIFSPAVLGAYWAAREANREVDNNRPINPWAVAGSGVLGMGLPGVGGLATSTAGRIGLGLAEGYGIDIANRAVQQAGDTGRVDLNQLDLSPGLGMATGGIVHGASGFQRAWLEHMSTMRRQVQNGEKTVVTLDDLFSKIKDEHNMTQQELDFLTVKTNTPPHNSPYRLSQVRAWAKGRKPNFIKNLTWHGEKHLPEFPEIPQNSLYYGDIANEFRADLPRGTELKIDPQTGSRMYYHELTNTHLVTSKTGEVQSFYRPKEGRQWFDTRPGIYYGVIRK